MVVIKTNTELEKLRENGRIVALVHRELKKVIEPGITTLELNDLAERIIRKEGALPSFIGYCGYPFTICASVNEVVVHGFPNERKLEEGDLLSIDVGTYKEGYCGDAAFTVGVGEITERKQKLIEVSEMALNAAIRVAKDGVTTGTLGGVIESVAMVYGFNVVRNYVGHGIGKEMHEQPSIYNFGKSHEGVVLKAGMCICIEPMLVDGDPSNYRLEDGWSVVTNEKSPSAHVEHQVIIHKDYAEIISI